MGGLLRSDSPSPSPVSDPFLARTIRNQESEVKIKGGLARGGHTQWPFGRWSGCMTKSCHFMAGPGWHYLFRKENKLTFSIPRKIINK
jgi:hypothetical protein